jgi:hypothetical protein
MFTGEAFCRFFGRGGEGVDSGRGTALVEMCGGVLPRMVRVLSRADCHWSFANSGTRSDFMLEILGFSAMRPIIQCLKRYMCAC